jgi:asparagine synthase (glutamine-hydrolysing)
MCGIAGIVDRKEGGNGQEGLLKKMLGMIRHRGPDQFGIYLDEQASLGSARLSIIDLACGQQPITNEDGRLWIVFNGEIFNYVELRHELEEKGHRFATRSDTEVILHLYEELGADCLKRFNGQFAMAIWDNRDKTLFLARDRLGVRPLFYTHSSGRLLFASEIKALFVDSTVSREIDFTSLDQVFTFWAPLTPRTIFQNIFEIPPGHFLIASKGEVKVKDYWSIDFQLQESSPGKSDRGLRNC